ncbi:hypothetical protein ACW9KT_19470 [Hymenobacter sp. HD11105]
MATQENERGYPVTNLYKFDASKQWFCAIVFLVAGAFCWYWIEDITKNAAQVRVAILAVLGLQAYSLWQYYQWRRETMDTLHRLEDAEPDMNKVLDAAMKDRPILSALKPIWDKLHAGRLHHQDILVHITSLQYALASTLILASLGGAIAAFFILPTGWDGAKQLLTTLFLSMVVMVTYCQVTPKVLSLTSNLTIHLARYHAFLALRWHVYRYVTTGKGTDGKDQTAQMFLNDLTQQLIELPPAPFGIDPSQVTSISALAQQFSFRSVQNADTPDSKGSAGAPPPRGASGTAGSNTAGADNDLPKYPQESRVNRSTLEDQQVLAGLNGFVQRAVEIKEKLPSWMQLDEATGAIRLLAKGAAQAGEYKGEVLLTLSSGNYAICPVLITIVEDVAEAGKDSGSTEREAEPTTEQN